MSYEIIHTNPDEAGRPSAIIRYKPDTAYRSAGIFRRHIFINILIEQTGTHVVTCARCFKIKKATP